FQLIYQSDSSVLLKGGFYVNEDQAIIINEIIQTVRAADALTKRMKLKPIFKHPRWKYPGMFVDKLPAPPTPWRKMNGDITDQLSKFFPPDFKKKIVPRVIADDPEAELFARNMISVLEVRGLNVAPIEFIPHDRR